MLSPFTEYSCTVSAFTVLPGPMSAPVNVTTAEAGTIGVNLVATCIV